MKVHIEGDLYLESNGIEFSIERYGRPYINGKGEEVIPKTNLGHFGNISHAINKLVKLKLMESNATDLKELLSEVKDVRKFIEDRVAV